MYIIVDSETGKRKDRTDYPITAIREAILNALVHCDYSIHTEGMPIQIIMFENRIEIRNPGGIYGRIRIDQLGKVQPDTRNPIIASELEVLKITENRYSGIPTIRREMKEHGLPEPLFENKRNEFVVTLFNKTESPIDDIHDNTDLITFCKTPRTRQEISDYLDLKTVYFVTKKYIQPLVNQGKLKLLYPDKPNSKNQKYYS